MIMVSANKQQEINRQRKIKKLLLLRAIFDVKCATKMNTKLNIVCETQTNTIRAKNAIRKFKFSSFFSLEEEKEPIVKMRRKKEEREREMGGVSSMCLLGLVKTVPHTLQ